MVDIFEESLESRAGTWVVKIVKRRLETGPKALELVDKKAGAGIAIVKSVVAAGNALQPCCVGVSLDQSGCGYEHKVPTFKICTKSTR